MSVRAPVTRSPVINSAPERFPFDIDFQKILLKLLCVDGGFARAVHRHLQPQFFESEVLAWAFAICQRNFETYGVMPSLQLLLQKTRELDPRVRPLYTATIEQVMSSPMTDEGWLRDSVLDFVKRNVFVRAFSGARDLYNGGQVTNAYDEMMEAMETIRKTTWEPMDRSMFFDELPARESHRLQTNAYADAIPTGIGWLDTILNGGLSLGEVGVWLAYPKIGKSTMLMKHGQACCRISFKRCLHIVLEGSRKQVETKYDAAFSSELYAEIKDGGIRDAAAYARLYKEYEMLRGLLVIRGFTDRWDYSVLDIDTELNDLRRQGFKPDMIVLDYLDLLSGRNPPYKSETEKQRAASRDVKALANRGYALWTATQAQRMKEGAEDVPDVLTSSKVADCYDKVRVVDFWGSLNQTRLERDAKQLRLYAEMYRDAPAGQVHSIRADYSRMILGEDPKLIPVDHAKAAAEVAAKGGIVQGGWAR
jgi:hypothetical protein